MTLYCIIGFFTTLCLVLLGLFIRSLYLISDLRLDLRYLSYCVGLLNCTNYELIVTKDGRNMTLEEDFTLTSMRSQMNSEAEYLGLSEPYLSIEDE